MAPFFINLPTWLVCIQACGCGITVTRARTVTGPFRVLLHCLLDHLKEIDCPVDEPEAQMQA
jgi:hypothetical protein